jgi:hypothetical protein
MVRIAVRRLLVSVLLVLVLMPFGVSNAFASIPPAPDVQIARDAFFVAFSVDNPQLAGHDWWKSGINGVTPTLATLDGFKAWYAADPAAVVAFLTFLNANPTVASQVYAWIAANPAAAAQLFIALSQNPWIAANPAAAAQLLTGLNKTQGD